MTAAVAVRGEAGRAASRACNARQCEVRRAARRAEPVIRNMGVSKMRIGIIGAGAIGCVVGGMLTKAGRDVTLIDQWPEHVETMRRQGLRLSGTCGDHVIRVKAIHVHELQSVTQPFEAAFVAVKSYDTEWATALVLPYLARPDGRRRGLPERDQRRAGGSSGR